MFPAGPEILATLLPEDEIVVCPSAEALAQALDADVIVPLMHRLEPELIANTRARLIQQWGIGLEGVDIAAATARGIAVCNVPGDVTPNADATAEHAVFLMMGLARHIHSCARSFRNGLWGTPLGEPLSGKSALIVGFGRVGSALGTKLAALGMKVLAVRRNPVVEPENPALPKRVGTLDNLLEMAGMADFVVSTIVLNDQTRGLFDKRLFHAMKPSAYFVNVSRGPVVNETDLLESLRSGAIAGAGLDVFTQEPLPQDHPFLTMENVIATPHVAGATRENYDGIGRVVVENLSRLKDGRELLYRVNPD